MKYKKILVIFLLVIFTLLLNSNTSNASLYLNNLDFKVQINEDGSMDVMENWNINISETNTLYKTFDIDKDKYSELTNISVKEIVEGNTKQFDNTKTWKYHLTKGDYFGGINNDGQYEIAWGVDIDSNTTRKYQISYTVLDAVKKYGDCAELYWQFIGDKFEIDAKNVTGIIKLPKEAQNKEDIKVWGHTKYLNGEVYVTDYDTVEFNLNKYKSKEYVEIRIAMPKEMITNASYVYTDNMLNEIIEEEQKWAEEANIKREKIMKQRIYTVMGISILLIAIGLILIKGIKKSKRLLRENPAIKSEWELDYFRELPDETATSLEGVFMLNKGATSLKLPHIISATLLSLALKKNIEITQDKKEINIKIIDKNKEKLEKEESILLELLETVSDGENTSMKKLEHYIKRHPSKYTSIDKNYAKLAEEKSEQKGKFNKEIHEKGIQYTVKLIGYIFLFIIISIVSTTGCLFTLQYTPKLFKYIIMIGIFSISMAIINIILVIKLANRFHGFTQKGVNEQKQWKAFKKYMEDFSLLNEKEVPHLVLWEKYLIFATAFGIAEKVLNQLKIKYPELNNPDIINNMVLFNIMYNGGIPNTKFISSLNTATSHMHSSTYSSGTGGGGGFSGGGGGRRPVEEAGGGR